MKYLRKILCLIMAVLCLSVLVSCDNDAESAGSEKNDGEKNTAGVSYSFEYNGVKVELGAAADKIISSLGEYRDKKEIGDCGGLGAQVRYSYSSFEVYVLESKTDGNIIDQITFRDDLVETSEGVYIGMSVTEVKKLLGTPTDNTDSKLEYLSGKKLLRIGVENGNVTEIDYMRITE